MYSADLSKCYGCGLYNEHGMQLKSYWDGHKAVARFTPQEHHIALPGFVYGGLLACLIDCHGVATAAAVATFKNNPDQNKDITLARYVTAALHVYFMQPTPLGKELVLQADRKSVV